MIKFNNGVIKNNKKQINKYKYYKIINWILKNKYKKLIETLMVEFYSIFRDLKFI